MSLIMALIVGVSIPVIFIIGVLSVFTTPELHKQIVYKFAEVIVLVWLDYNLANEAVNQTFASFSVLEMGLVVALILLTNILGVLIIIGPRTAVRWVKNRSGDFQK